MVLTVCDVGRAVTAGRAGDGVKGGYARYNGALVDVFRLKNGGAYHEVHGSLQVQTRVANTSKNPRSLGRYRMYTMSQI